MKIFKNPYLNSLFAEAYIILIASVMHFAAKPDTPDTLFEPIAALSVFVLSAAVMGYLFVGQPLQLYLDGEKKAAVSFFMRTVGSFAVIAIATLVIVSNFVR